MPEANFRNCDSVSPQCPVGATTYGYYPSSAASIAFIIVFALTCIGQLVLGIRYKTYPYMIAAAIATFGEAVGYGGRLMMHKNPWSDAGFKMQIVCLVLAPSFLAACIYLTLKHVVKYCGEQYSRLRPVLYTWCFIGGDFGSIILQAIGGGVASAGGNDKPNVAETGDHLIVAGIAFQAVVMAICALVIGEFYWRLRNQRPIKNRQAAAKEGSPSPAGSRDEEMATAPLEKRRSEVSVSRNAGGPGVDGKFKIFMCSVGFAFLTIFIRCIYR